MPLITIHLIEGREAEKKSRLIRDVTDAAVQALDVPAATVRVLLLEMPAAHWGIGGVSQADIMAEQMRAYPP